MQSECYQNNSSKLLFIQARSTAAYGPNLLKNTKNSEEQELELSRSNPRSIPAEVTEKLTGGQAEWSTDAKVEVVFPGRRCAQSPAMASGQRGRFLRAVAWHEEARRGR